MQKEILYKLIAKKFTKEISEDENRELEKWINEESQNKKLYEKLNSIWQKSVDTNINFNPEIQTAIRIFKERIKNVEKQKQRKIIRLRIIRIAASIVILLGFSLYFISQKRNFNTIEVITDNISTKQIMLPDSSWIHLNKNTTIKYKKSFKNRIIDLNGEAFFKVKKQNKKPFTVKSNTTYTKVLGTSFNIKSRKEINNNVQIFVLTGKVKFSGDNKEKAIILSPNQSAVYTDEISEIEISELTNKNLLAWKTSILKFDNNTLKEVLNTLKDVYDIEYSVTDNNILDLKVTCAYDNIDIENILNDLEIILPITITVEDQLVKIKSSK